MGWSEGGGARGADGEWILCGVGFIELSAYSSTSRVLRLLRFVLTDGDCDLGFCVLGPWNYLSIPYPVLG